MSILKNVFNNGRRGILKSARLVDKVSSHGLHMMATGEKIASFGLSKTKFGRQVGAVLQKTPIGMEYMAVKNGLKDAQMASRMIQGKQPVRPSALLRRLVAI